MTCYSFIQVLKKSVLLIPALFQTGVLMNPPKDLFKFVERNQVEIKSLTEAFGEFLRERQPNSYCVLTSLTNVVDFIISHNFVDADNAEHLALLTAQTLEAFQNTITEAAEQIMRGRFNESLFEDEDYEISYIGRC